MTPIQDDTQTIEFCQDDFQARSVCGSVEIGKGVASMYEWVKFLGILEAEGICGQNGLKPIIYFCRE
jgi:hypothetical protein